MYMYIMYLRHKDAILAILCMSLPITTTHAGKWLNSLKFHDDIQANRQMIICVGIDYIRPVMIVYFTQAILSLLYGYGITQCHMIGITVHLYGFTIIM